MAILQHPRFLIPGLPLGVCLLVVMSGCSHPLEVDVPANVHGKVTVLCDAFSSTAAPIQVNAEGTAEHAVCPTSESSLVVVRNGQPVKPVTPPNWSTTGDGILLSVEFDLP